MSRRVRPVVAGMSLIAVVCALTTAAGAAPASHPQPGQDRASEACHRGTAGGQRHAPGIQRLCNGEPSSAGVAKGDFDGDTIGDLAIGVPLEDIGSVKDAGAVHVIYGTSSGLSGAGNQLWHQDVPNVNGVAEAYDNFGAALASGDFDNDGYSDLAIGAPGESVSSMPGAGVVQVLYGGPNGVTTAGQQVIAQGVNGMRGTAETGDRFGQTLAWGRFDGGLTGDLAIGAPDEDVGSVTNAGAVNVVYGMQDVGLHPNGGPGNQLFTQAEVGLVPEPYDGFGATMTAGDFDGNSHHDLAVAAHSESVRYGGQLLDHAGRVTVVFANISGLGIARTHVTRWNISFNHETGAHDHFGFSLATRRFASIDYLIVGIPWADFRTFTTVSTQYVNSGLVQEFAYDAETGTMDPIGSEGDEYLSDPESGRLYGYALAVGNFQGEGFNLLAVGAPGAFDGAGMVLVHWSDCDPHPNSPMLLSQHGLSGEPEAGDGLGSSLSAWDWSGDKVTDLAVGVPGEDLAVGGVSYRDAGTVHVVYGKARASTCGDFGFGEPGGLKVDSEQRLQQGGALAGVSLQGTVEAYDEFGRALY